MEKLSLQMSFLRDMGRMLFLLSITALAYYLVQSNFVFDADNAAESITRLIMLYLSFGITVLFVVSLAVDAHFYNYRESLRHYVAAPKEDCLLIQDYMVHPEINTYRHSVVEQGRAFVKGDVKAMEKKYIDINKNKLIDEACKNVYEIGGITK